MDDDVLEEETSIFHKVNELGRNKVLDYQDTWSPTTFSGRLENEISSRCFHHLENEFEKRILDVYGDGNCLYYCLLFQLQVVGMHPDPNNICKKDKTKTLVNKLRRQLQKYYYDYYGLEDNFNMSDPVAAVNTLTENEFRKRKILTDFAQYQGTEFFATERRYNDGEDLNIALIATRMLYDDVKWDAEDIYKEGFLYIRRNPKHNYNWYNDLKASQKVLDNRRIKQPPYPDAHFIIRESIQIPCGLGYFRKPLQR